MVEESEAVDAENVINYSEELKEKLGHEVESTTYMER